MLQIYKSYILPHLDYAASVWSPYLQKDIAALESVQRRFTRMIQETRGLAYEERLTVLGLTTLRERRNMIDLTQVYRLRNGIDQINKPLFKAVHETHTRNTRSSSKGDIAGSKTNLELRRQFFTNRVVGPWNSLPQEIKMAPSLGTFKSKLKNHFL